MKRPTSLRSLGKALPLLVVAAALLLVTAPAALGLSSGANKDTVADPHFGEWGCVACHGGGSAAPHDFADTGANPVTFTIVDAEGVPPVGNTYAHDGVYTITITLDEQTEPTASNRAGFNLRVGIGALEGVEGNSQISDDGLEATHVDASSVEWVVTWTAPAEDAGPAVFDIWVNDVDGSAVPDAGDDVYRTGFWLTGDSLAIPGAAAEEHEAHYGVSLPQYWLGLIALAMTVVIIMFGFIYQKYVSPHNTDQKDR